MNRGKQLAALILALLLVLLAGCGGSGGEAQTTQSVSSPSTTLDTPNPESNITPPADSSPYNFAAGNFETDERGFPLEKYEYTLPISTTDEVLTFWTTSFSPQYISEEGFGAMPYPTELRERTGINIEYTIVPSETLNQSFSVLLASDDLCDISANADVLYPGTMEEAVLEEKYFVNIYEYREYCPNYFYEAAVRDPDDMATYYSIFYKNDLVYAFKAMNDKKVVGLNSQIRGDWLDDLGISVEDIVTFDDFYDVLVRFKNEIETCTFPWAMLRYIDMVNAYTLNAFDTLPCVSENLFGPLYVVDGQATLSHTTQNDFELMTMLNQFYNDGLIDPDWGAWDNNQGYATKVANGEIGYIAVSPAGAESYEQTAVDPDCKWIAMKKLLRYEGQVIHVGGYLPRTAGGSSCISTKCENIPLAISWCDYYYSDSGAFFTSYGVEGLTFEYNEEGVPQATEWALSNPDGLSFSWLQTLYGVNPLAEHGLELIDRKFAYPGGEDSAIKYDIWNDYEYDGSYEWPTGANLNAEQSAEAAEYTSDIQTYILENYLAFLDGSKPLTEWDSYVQELNTLGVPEVLEIYQQAYDDYMAQHA